MAVNDELIKQYKSQWATANAKGDKAGMEAAHNAAEAERSKGGYSGGANGSQHIKTLDPISAYTPSGSYNDRGVSQQDKGGIDSLKSQYDKYKNQAMADGIISTGEKAALDKIHSQADGVRSSYGYLGGNDGSGYIPLEDDNPRKSPIYSATSQNDYINALYEAQQRQALAKLKAAYDQNTISLDAAAAKIPAIYQSARNQTAATAEQNKANFNERAVASGLNSGAGSQASLAMGNQLTGNMSAINTQEANATTDIETQRLQLSTQYQNAIAQAEATGDLAKAQALYQEAIRVDNSLVQQSQLQADENYRYWTAQNQVQQQQLAMQRKQAETLAAYGDFSGFGELGYSPDQISNMQTAWAVKNPLIAASRGINVGGYTSGYTGGYSKNSYSSGHTSSYSGSSKGTSSYTATTTKPNKPTAPTSPTGKATQKKYNLYVEDLNHIAESGGDAGSQIKSWLKQGKISDAQAEKMAGMFGG